MKNPIFLCILLAVYLVGNIETKVRGTIEIDVFVDRLLDQDMKENGKGKKDVRNLFKKVGQYLRHPSISSKITFGYKLRNIITLGPMIWDKTDNTYDIYGQFNKWAKEYYKNPPRIPNAALLLTSYDYVTPGGWRKKRYNANGQGWAAPKSVCRDWINRKGFLIIRSGKGSIIQLPGNLNAFFARLIAHEIGHVLWARHDHQNNNCPTGKHLMSPSVGEQTTTWSTCTRKYIDDAFRAGELDCLMKK